MKYEVRFVQLRKGVVVVEADSADEAEVVASGKEVDYYDEEIIDTKAVPVAED